MIVQNLKQSFRSMKNNQLFFMLNITGFAVGFAVCMVIALFAYHEYNVDKDYNGYRNIFRVIDAKKNSSRIDFDFAKQLKDQYPEIKSAIPLNYAMASEDPIYLKKLTGQGFILAREMVSTTNDFFKTFSVKILYGDAQQPFADLNSVVMTRSSAQKLFGRVDVVGEQINVASAFNLAISAVSEDLPQNSSLGADIFFNGDNKQYRFSEFCHNKQCYNPVDIYVLLNAKADVKQLESHINAKVPVNKSDTEKVNFQPLTDIYLHPGIEGNTNKAGSKSMIRIFLSIAVLIMLLSVINYVNYTLSKQLSTLKEIGIKITNGAGIRHLRAYYLTDITLSILIAFVAAIGLTALFLPYAGLLFNTSLSFSWLLSPVLTVIFASVLLGVILVSALTPVYIISRFDIQKLFGKKETRLGNQFGKRVLTIFQLSAAIALLIGLFVIEKQLHYVRTTDMGFNKEQLLRIDFGQEFKNKAALKQQLDHCSIVLNSSFSKGAPGSINISMGGNPDNGENFMSNCIYVDEQFLKTFGIKLLDGREFMTSDMNNSCYVNETAYKRFGWDNLENRKFNNGKEGGYNVIGVVRDFNVASMHSGISPVCLMFCDQYMSVNIRLAPGNVGEQIKMLRKVWSRFAPEIPMVFTFYDEFFNAFYKKEERQGKAITFFSLITFIITCLGLMGQVFQTCNARIKEIGIRKVNGAKISEILSMLNRDLVKWVAIAFVIATPVAYYAMNKWLESFAYKTELSWWIFALAGLMALGIALLTVSWQSWKAASRNPVEALRYE